MAVAARQHIDVRDSRLAISLAGAACAVIVIAGVVYGWATSEARIDARFQALESKMSSLASAVEASLKGGDDGWGREEAMVLCVMQHGEACRHPGVKGYRQ